MDVIINGVRYVPKAEIAPTDKNIIECLEVLTEMRRFNEGHKMMGLAWNAIHALSPDIAKLGINEAYDKIHNQ